MTPVAVIFQSPVAGWMVLTVQRVSAQPPPQRWR